ncbi:mechanosensitive ion channel [Rhodobacterales bacterium HKCCE2091]|nr:mechanosensitive ion channel [Rhodobacterales bacterium HKCCE2091]
MRAALIAIALVAALAWAAVVPAPVAAQTGQPTGEISVESDAMTDAAIANRIREILGQLDGYEGVAVSVADGIVTLRGTAIDAARIAELTELVGRVRGVVAIENEVHETTDLAERLSPAVERIRSRAVQLVAYSPLLLVAIAAGAVVFLAGLGLARLKQPWDRIAPNAFIADIYRQIIRLVFAVAGVVLALDLLNATALLGTFLGAAGIVGLAIGFAVRDTVENFIASVMLSVRQPFRPKDLVEIEGDTGHVIRLTSRATILLSLDGNHIRIPNSTVFKSRIVNFSRNDTRRFDFELGIAPEADIAEAQSVIRDALAELPFVLDDPAPSVWVNGVGEATISVSGAGWIMQHQTDISMAKGEAIRIAKARLEAAGIALPGPSLRILSDGARQAGPRVAAPAAAAAAAVAVDVDARDTQALERLVEAEREVTGDDLLAREAPQE